LDSDGKVVHFERDLNAVFQFFRKFRVSCI
jgi:hypothetical protein